MIWFASIVSLLGHYMHITFLQSNPTIFDDTLRILSIYDAKGTTCGMLCAVYVIQLMYCLSKMWDIALGL